jgi:hypothetical protein
MARESLGEADRLIVVPQPENSAAKPSSPVLPAGIKIDQLHTGIGAAGGLAQPLSEPEE